MSISGWVRRRLNRQVDSSTPFSLASSNYFAAFEKCEPFTRRAMQADVTSSFLSDESTFLNHSEAVRLLQAEFMALKATFEEAHLKPREEYRVLKILLSACDMQEISLTQFNKICLLTELETLKTIAAEGLLDEDESPRRRELLTKSEEVNQLSKWAEVALESLMVSKEIFKMIKARSR